MRRTIFLLEMVTLLTTAAGLISTRHAAAAEVAAHSKTVIFHVDGMTCTLCKHAGEKALSHVAGVEHSDVDPSTGPTLFTVRPEVQPYPVAATIQQPAYPPPPVE